MRKSVLYVSLSAVLFSLGGLLFKFVSWDALAASSARSILAGVCIFLFLLRRRHRYVINRDVVAAALAIAMTNTLYAGANKLTTAGNAIVLEFSMPAFVILIMLVFFHKKPTKLQVLTCGAVLFGIILFFVDSLSAGNMAGNLLALLAGMTYACFFVFNTRPDSEPFSAILLSYVIAAAIGLPALLKTPVFTAPPIELLAVLALGLLQQGAAQIFLAMGIKKVSPVTGSLISGIEPILNPIWVAVFYHEMLTPLSLLGAALVLGSVLLYNYKNAKEVQA